VVAESIYFPGVCQGFFRSVENNMAPWPKADKKALLEGLISGSLKKGSRAAVDADSSGPAALSAAANN
jgi:hypothetical protein